MTTAHTCQAIVLRAKGEVALEEITLPPLQPDQVLIRMVAAAIHPADLNIIEGTYPTRLQPPFVGGREGAGIVEETGENVSTLDPGDLVILPPDGGVWREFAIHHAADLVQVPKTIEPEQAALLRINPGTALRMLRDFLPLLPGEWIVQNAANSAVGRAAIQLARHFGWHTVNLVRDPSRLDDELLATGDIFLADDSESAIHEAAGGPLRLGLNAVGGESALRIANALADGGTMVTYGAMARQPVRIPNGLFIFRDLQLRGFWMTRWAGHVSPLTMQGMISELIGLTAAGVLRSRVERVYRLEDFSEALAHAAKPRRGGKILFGVPGPDKAVE